MAGLAQNTPLPTNIVVHQRSRELGVDFSDGSAFRFSFEFLRVNSPSAEVQGHSPDQAVLQYGKREVLITEIEQVGDYAIRPGFSAGRGSGIHSCGSLSPRGTGRTTWRSLTPGDSAATATPNLPHPSATAAVGVVAAVAVAAAAADPVPAPSCVRPLPGQRQAPWRAASG